MKSPLTTRVTPEGDSSVHSPMTAATASVAKETQTGEVIAAKSDSSSKTTQQITTQSIFATQEAARTSPRMTSQPRKTVPLGRNPVSTTLDSSGIGKTLLMPLSSFAVLCLDSELFFNWKNLKKESKKRMEKADFSMESGVHGV